MPAIRAMPRHPAAGSHGLDSGPTRSRLCRSVRTAKATKNWLSTIPACTMVTAFR